MKTFPKSVRLFGATMAIILACGLAVKAQTELPLEDLYKIGELARMRPFVKVASFSSYDRTGGNDDGFSGKYSFLRKEDGALVIAEMNGPGVITRFHTPTPTDDLVEFFFDGERTPRLVVPFRKLFSGDQYPFLSPLVGHGGGGYFSYVPLQFQKSCKIRGTAPPKLQFYQLNYALYAPGTKVTTFDAKDEKFRASVERIRHELDAKVDVTRGVSGVERRELTLQPGGSVTLFDRLGPGRVAGIKLIPASRFAGAGQRYLLRAIWDGEKQPAILCPVGDFFGYGFGKPASESLLFGTHDELNYSYFPMPFDRAARIEIVSEEKSGAPVQFESEVDWTMEGRHAEEGRFYAHWESENPVPQGQPFTFVDTKGEGHLAGVILQSQGLEPGQTEFFEGDDEATVDGELTIHGTGSEDFFNGGWYDVAGRWYERMSLPLSGALTYEKPAARTGAYRILLPDAYSFHRSLQFTIEHGPEGNVNPANYTSVAFLYMLQPPTAPPMTLQGVPGANSRRLVFIPGWNQPIYAFSMDNMTLGKHEEKLGDEKSVRFLSIEAQGEESFGPHYVAFTVNVPESGVYEVSVEGVTGPRQGTAQLLINDQLAGAAAHFSASERRPSGLIRLGMQSMRAGENHIFFRVGNEGGNGDAIRVDLVKIVLEPACG